MKPMTKMLLLVGIGLIASETSLSKIHAAFDLEQIEQDFSDADDGIAIVDHMLAAMAEVFSEYRRSSESV